MLELDEATRQNQRNYLPFSRDEQAEKELYHRHPSLKECVEHSKRVKIDQVGLHSRLREKESRISLGRKTSGDLLDDFESPSARKSPR